MGRTGDAAIRDDVTPADGGYAPDRWAFDGEVTRVFEDMLERSIPQYRVMRDAVTQVGLQFAKTEGHIVDLGCSRGEALAPFVDFFGTGSYYTGVEVSPPMIEAARERFAHYLDAGVLEIQPRDLRESYPGVTAGLTLAVLTMCFIPMEHRQRVLRDVYEHTTEGGAFIMVEKVLGGSAEIERMMVQNYYGLKHGHGYSWTEIERKRLSLEGVLVPMTARMNEEMLRGAGFRQVDCFWRWMNFAAWVAVRDGNERL